MTRKSLRPLDDIVARVRAKLVVGEERVHADAAPGLLAWWPLAPPDSGEQLAADYGVPTRYPEIERQFREEVAAFHEALRELDAVAIPPSSGSNTEDAITLGEVAIALRAKALSLWDIAAFPVRASGDMVYRIISPTDLYGSPIVQEYPVHRFVREVAVRTASDAAYIAHIEARLTRWKALAGTALATVIMCLLFIVRIGVAS